MLKRFELHNHTTHSDAQISCRDLAEHMEKDHVDVLALTDHNTISGHEEMKRLLHESGFHVQAVYGMEYTTYYGHILCLNLHRYVPWENIDRRHPERLFSACRKAGALTGVAHPFSYGAPFARGCRFEMEIHDFTDVDFIEIMNNPEPLREVNEPALRWWESLCLNGEQLAATAGMDLHDRRDMSMQFASYLEGEAEGDPEKELETAIRKGRTWVSHGMILHWEKQGESLCFSLEDVHKPGFRPGKKWLMTLKSADEERVYELPGTGLRLKSDELPDGPVLIVKLYQDTVGIEDLVCVAPVIRLRREAAEKERGIR